MRTALAIGVVLFIAGAAQAGIFIPHSEMLANGGGAVTGSSTYTATYGNPLSVINGVGLLGGGLHSTDTYGGRYWLTAWTTAQWTTQGASGAIASNVWLKVDLGKLYSVDQVDIWTYAMNLQTYRGVKDFRLDVSEDDITYVTATTGSLHNVTSAANATADTFSFDPINAQYVMIVPLTSQASYGGQTGTAQNAGLSEMQIFGGDPIAVPEPATVGLLALGGLGVLFRRRRR